MGRDPPNLGDPSPVVRLSDDYRPEMVSPTLPNSPPSSLRRCLSRSLRRYLEEADLPLEIRFHDLRHTAGTLALRQGVPLHTVSRMLGHSDPATTLRMYTHVLDDMREDAALAIDELL